MTFLEVVGGLAIMVVVLVIVGSGVYYSEVIVDNRWNESGEFFNGNLTYEMQDGLVQPDEGCVRWNATGNGTWAFGIEGYVPGRNGHWEIILNMSSTEVPWSEEECLTPFTYGGSHIRVFAIRDGITEMKSW